MNKNESELKNSIKISKLSSHEYLLNQVVCYIEKSNSKDAKAIRNTLPQLKRLRVKGDYKDEDFYSNDSKSSLTLASQLLPILKKHSS